MIQSSLTPQVEVPEDTAAPLLYLNGDISLTLRIGGLFSEPGTYVVDESATTVITTGTEALQAALATTNLSDLATTAQDGTYGPYIITYTGANAVMHPDEACLTYTPRSGGRILATLL